MTKKGVIQWVIQWENGLGGSGGYERIFSLMRVLGIRKKSKKIRSDPPDPPHPFSHCITFSKAETVANHSYII
jgi:hypothetical protein